jgi:ribose transport system substrate-binding protein
VEIPDSPFKPVDLEDTIDDLVQEIGETEPEALQLAMVLKEVTGFWEPVKVGANRAFGELAVSGVVLAPAEDTVEEANVRQAEILRERQDAGYDGLGVAPLSDLQGPEIDQFVDSGTPVVTIDSDLPESQRVLYIGTLNYEAGRTAGGTLVDMLGSESGGVVVLGWDEESTFPDGYNRTMGATDALEEAGYTVTVRETSFGAEGDVEDVEYLVEALETFDPPVIGMLSMFSPSYRCARAAEEAGRTAEDVTIVGFDFEPETQSYMQSGLIRATHTQRQYYFGYLTPYVLYSLKVLGTDSTMEILAPQMVDESRFNTGIDVVLDDQVDEYKAYLDSLGIGG